MIFQNGVKPVKIGSAKKTRTRQNQPKEENSLLL